MDYSNYKKSNILYSGHEDKIGLFINNEYFLAKFQKNTINGKINNCICEHIGSNVFRILGIESQITTLGTYMGENIVLCKDFINHDDSCYLPFVSLSEELIDIDNNNQQYSFPDIINTINNNIKIENHTAIVNRFWDIFIIDALLGNFDRHGYNWGFIKTNNQYKLAPVFDNGESLFPRIVGDDLIRSIINNKEELDIRTYKYPTSQIKIDGNKSSYFDVISSLKYNECNLSLKRIVKRYNYDMIALFINSISEISDLEIEFYKTIINYRYEKILLYSYNKLVVNE
jgi:hypothetical protein